MAFLKALLLVLCLLGLTYTASAQNLTASTPAQNLTLITQDMNNFTNQALPSFPCDSTQPGLAGGYSTIDLDSDDDSTNSLDYVLNAVYTYYQYAAANLSDCSISQLDYYNVSNACSQVVAGTNYGVELTVIYDCIGLDTEIYSSTLAPLRATVFVPLSAASFQTLNQVENGPVIRDIWFYAPPEVIATSEAVPEESSPEAGPAPEAAPESSSNNETTTQLLNPSGSGLGLGSTSGSQLTFASPSASSSPPPSSPQAGGSTPEPQPVTGFDVAAQNQSIARG